MSPSTPKAPKKRAPKTAPADVPAPEELEVDPVIVEEPAPVNKMHIAHTLPLQLSIAAMVIAIAFALGAYFYLWQGNNRPVPILTNDDTTTVVDVVEEPNVIEDEPEAISYERAPLQPYVPSEHALNVDWLPIEEQERIQPDPTLVELFSNEDADFGESRVDAFVLGTVSSEPFQGSVLTQHIVTVAGMGTSYQYFYILEVNSPVGNSDAFTPHLLSRYSGDYGQSNHSDGPMEFPNLGSAGAELNRTFTRSNEFIADFERTRHEWENQVEDTDGNRYRLISISGRVNFPEENEGTALFPTRITLTDGRALTLNTDSNLFEFVREDGRVVSYDLITPLWPGHVFTHGRPAIVWNDGRINGDEYTRGELGGCGFTSIVNVVDQRELPELVEVGYTTDYDGTQQPVFEPASFNDEVYEFAYNTWVSFYGRNDEANYTRSRFASIHPFVYYKDIFDRWVEMRNSDILPAVECGKPVIYLYPEKTTDIDVTLKPVGGFTVTEPVYQDGWRVTATPDSILTNRDDNTQYPYLFWEGLGGLYSEPDRFWVVAREDIPEFLTNTLHNLGLSTRETVDFIEFWGPRMDSANYYKIGFHGTETMDQIAPMSLSLEPDTYLRILMDYTELDTPVKENPPRLPQVQERKGFSVIEWGGVLRRY